LVGHAKNAVAAFAISLASDTQPDLNLQQREQFSVVAQGGPQDQSSGGRDHARERMEEFLRQRMPQNEETEEFLRQHLPQVDKAEQHDHKKKNHNDPSGDPGPQP